jgi:hypothetical protein
LNAEDRRAGRWFFLLSAAFLLFVGGFAYGYFASQTKSFPYPIITQALIDVDDVMDLVRANAHEIRSSRRQGGVTINDRELVQPGLTFLTAYDGEFFRPLLIDVEGKVLHRWDARYSTLFKGEEEIDLVPDSQVAIHGAQLYEDGSVLASFAELGLAKLDHCSRLLWRLSRKTHHAILPLADGSFWTLSIDRNTIRRPYLRDRHKEETLLHVSTDGKVLEEINVIDAIMKGGYQSLVLQGEPSMPTNEWYDPIHLNDVELVTTELAMRIPQARAGDFLVSLRGSDSLAVIGRDSRAVIWSMVGPFLRQHDPDIFADGTLLVFDNRMEIKQRTPVRWLEEPQVWGYSRLLRLDPATQQVLWSFGGSGQFPFYTSIHGKQQILGNGNILVSDPEGGRAFEISPAHGNRVVWEYVNALDGKGDGLLGRVTEATRYEYDGTQFLGKTCP